MKNLIKISMMVCLMALTGCNKFLDVVPKTQSPQDVLFDFPQGFKDALTGVYIQMKGSSLYGADMSYGTIEHLVSSWDVESNSTNERINLFNYHDQNVQNKFDEIYKTFYSTIASANAILGKIDEKRQVLKSEELYRLIKGEALAIRAYLHLDVLRMFGPVPTAIDPSLKLPYVTDLSKTPNNLIDYANYLTKIQIDLQEAENLLRDIDPIIQGGSPSDDFFMQRRLRLNYYAVKALQARLYLWQGKNQEAYTAAKMVIEAEDQNGAPAFSLGSLADLANKDYVLTKEHIFGLYDFKMATTYTDVFAKGTYRKGKDETQVKQQLYGNTGIDSREANLWRVIVVEGGAQYYIMKKYEGVNNLGTGLDAKQIPMLRLSEMYLIAAEVAPLAEAQTYWDDFLSARNKVPTPLNPDDAQRKADIVREYRREFYAEGQAFYAYKRINAPRISILFAPSAATVNYVVPLPMSETATLNR